MLTFKAEIRKNEMKVGGTFNVKIRVTYNREVKRLATHIFVRTEDLTKDFKLKNPKYIKEADKLVRYYEELCMGLPLEASNLTLNDVLDYIQKEKEKNTPIDFIQFCKDWLTTTEVKGKRNYQTTLNTFIAFLGKDKLNTNQVTKLLMMEFMEYLHKKRAKQVATEWCLYTWEASGIYSMKPRRSIMTMTGMSLEYLIHLLRIWRYQSKKQLGREHYQ